MIDKYGFEFINCIEMKQFIDEVKRTVHPLYTLMHNAPQTSIMIMCTPPVGGFDEMTVAEFERQYAKYDPNVYACVLYIRSYNFETRCKFPDYDEMQEEWRFEILRPYEFEIDKIAKELPRILAHICRRAIMDGRPLVMNEATIAEYGFTADDVEQLGDLVATTNARLMERFAKDAAWLNAIVERGV